MIDKEQAENDYEIDIGEYEVVRSGFFSHIKEPAFTVNVDKISVNAACVRLLPDVEYVQILINRKEKKLLLLPCSDVELTGYRWGKLKNGKRYSLQRTGEPFVLSLCKLMGWNPDYRYKVIGKMIQSRGVSLIAFDLKDFECFPKKISSDGKKVNTRRALFSDEWNGKFGPTFAESRGSIQINTFNDYTVISINDKNSDIKEESQSTSEDSKAI